LIQTPATELVRGQTVNVPLLLRVEQPLKARGIHARFWGAEETKANYTTTSTDSKGHTTTQTHTATEHVNIVDQSSLLSGNEQLGFFGNLSDALATLVGGGKHEVIAPGEYPFEVQVSAPETAPATHKGEKSRVFYELSAWVDIPLGFDLGAMQAFEVRPLPIEELQVQPVRVRYPDDAGRGFWDSMLAPDVRLELALTVDTARPGETIEGIFVVESEKPLTIDALRARWVGIEKSHAHGHDDTAHYSSEPIEIAHPGSVQGRFSQTFSLPV
jgi:hypothetical protein